VGDEDQKRLQGLWVRVGLPPPVVDEHIALGHDPGMLPATIEFTGSRFRATRSPGQGFSAWDVGTFDLAGDRLTISLANDAMEAYPVDIKGDEMHVTLGSGDQVRYQRRS